jgi:hypothetical protein
LVSIVGMVTAILKWLYFRNVSAFHTLSQIRRYQNIVVCSKVVLYHKKCQMMNSCCSLCQTICTFQLTSHSKKQRHFESTTISIWQSVFLLRGEASSDPIKWFNPAIVLCLSQARPRFSPAFAYVCHYHFLSVSH